MNTFNSISIIGTGHLGGALMRGLIRSGHPATSIMISNRDLSKSRGLSKELGVLTATTNTDAIENADIVLLALKPQMMQKVCEEIAPALRTKKPLIISLAGVIDTHSIALFLDKRNLGIVRVMTNTPTEFCKGTSALFANEFLTYAQKESIESLFNKVGYTFWVDQESMLDTLTAPIGCAPAYVFLFLEALQKAAMSRGISEPSAQKIALESVLGAAELARKSGRTFDQLRKSVTTPQGITAHSLQQLSFSDFFDTFKQIYSDAEERITEITTSLHPKS